MVITAGILVVCLGVGVAASARWLPDLADGATGGLAFFVVCGLVGAALAIAGLHVYETVRYLETFGGRDEGGIVANELSDMLLDMGTLLGVAMLVYLIAPRDEPSRATATRVPVMSTLPPADVSRDA